MAKGFWVKEDRYDPNSWRGVGGFFVKVSPSTWQTINDAWIKVKQTGTDAWQRFWASATNPDTPIEILTSYTSPGELLRLQGKNYHWTPAPSTLFYTFSFLPTVLVLRFSDSQILRSRSDPFGHGNLFSSVQFQIHGQDPPPKSQTGDFR